MRFYTCQPLRGFWYCGPGRTGATAAGFSQEAFADHVKIDWSYMSGIERGIRNISVLKVAAMAKALKVPISALFEDG